MAHSDIIVDSGSHFVIDPQTRIIEREDKTSLVLVQRDHNSERVTFNIPRYVDGHDMSTCDRVEIHYINIDKETKATSEDVYIVNDLTAESEETVSFTWLIASPATVYAGTLNFLIRFICLDEDSKVVYALNTNIYKSVVVGEGCECSVADSEEYNDVLASWAKTILLEVDVKLKETEAKIAYKTLSPNADLDNLQDGKYYISPDLQFTKVIDYTFDNPDTVDSEKANIWAGGIIANNNNSNALSIPNNVSGNQYMFGGDAWYNHGADIVQGFADGVLEFDACINGFTVDAEQLIIAPQHQGFRPGVAFIKNPSGDGVIIYANNGSDARSGVSTGVVVEFSTWHNYKIEYNPSANKVNYYVDNTLVYSKTDYVGTVKSETEIYPQMPKYFSIYANTTGSVNSEILIDSIKVYDTTSLEDLGLDKQDILIQKTTDDYCVQFRIDSDSDTVCSKRVKKLYGNWGRWFDAVALDETNKIPAEKLPNIPLSLLPNMPIHFGKMNTVAKTITELPDNSLIILSAPDTITVTVKGVSTATIESDTIILWTGGQGDDITYPNFRRTLILYTSALTVKSNNAVTKIYDNSGTASISIDCPAGTYKGILGNGGNNE